MGYAAKPQKELVLFYPQEAFSSPQLLKASRPILLSWHHLGKVGPGSQDSWVLFLALWALPRLPKATAQPQPP